MKEKGKEEGREKRKGGKSKEKGKEKKKEKRKKKTEKGRGKKKREKRKGRREEKGKIEEKRRRKGKRREGRRKDPFYAFFQFDIEFFTLWFWGQSQRNIVLTFIIISHLFYI